MSSAKMKREGWREVSLGNVAKLRQGKYIPTELLSEQKSEENCFSVYGAKGVRGYSKTFEYDATKTLITCRGAGCGFVQKTEPNSSITNSSIAFEVNAEKISDVFMYYWASSKDFSDVITGSAQPQITIGDLSKKSIFLATLPEQKAIAEVLSSLDDKIDLLRRQNKTLENMAQTLFRKWFVEDADEMWEKKPLDQIADYLNGLACQKYPPKNQTDKLPVLKIKELRNGFSENSDWVTSEIDSEYIVEQGDIIFSWSGSLITKIWDGTRCVLNQHLFKVSSKQYPKWYIYFWTKHHIEKFVQIAKSKATTMGHIKRNDLSNSMALVPSNKHIDLMDKVMAPYFEKKILNFHQIRTLEKLRDNLLPKLMRGEVRTRK